MMFTADQLVAHAVGDYILQSHWMAIEKTKQNTAAAIHAATYTLPFLLITQSVAALAVVCGSHYLIDRYRLARFLVWLKNGPFCWERDSVDDDPRLMLKAVTSTGYADDVPAWLSVWLLIAADNIIHVICNALAIAYL